MPLSDNFLNDYPMTVSMLYDIEEKIVELGEERDYFLLVAVREHRRNSGCKDDCKCVQYEYDAYMEAKYGDQ